MVKVPNAGAGNQRIGILLAVHASLFRTGLRNALEGEGDMLVIGETADAKTTLADAARLHPSVTVLNLFGDAAPETCRYMKSAGLKTKVLVVGTSDKPQELLAAVEGGADGYVPTSAGLPDVVVAVRQLHGGSMWVPPEMLGPLVSNLIDRRRSESSARERVRQLSRRERQVLAELIHGLEPKIIAEKLFVSPHTVRTHVQNLLEKLEVHSRVEAVGLAMESGLFAPDASERVRESGV